MPELAYMAEQHRAAMPPAKDKKGLSALLQMEKQLALKCGRAVLQRLSMPPDLENVRATAARMRRLQQEHDDCFARMKRPSAVSDGDWDAFADAWREMVLLDMNMLCEYCAECGRDIRKRIRGGKTDSKTLAARVQAICEISSLFPDTARSEPRALLDFYQQGILDLRRLRTAMRDMGMAAEMLDAPIAALSAVKRKLSV